MVNFKTSLLRLFVAALAPLLFVSVSAADSPLGLKESNWGESVQGRQVGLIVTQSTFSVAEPVIAVAVLRNVGELPVAYPGTKKPTDLRWIISENGKPILPRERERESDSLREVRIEPNSTHQYTFDLRSA